MVTISELKERKKELCYSNKMISDISGVPVSTLQKIFGGSTETPRYETLLKLERALFPTDRELRVGDPYYRPDGTLYKMHVKEPEEAYAYDAYCGYDRNFATNGKKQGKYTVKDYLALPDDVRMELIDGKFYDMAAPTTIHQFITAEIYAQLSSALLSSDGDCLPFISPVDVQFEDDDEAEDMLQPDVAVVCDRNKYVNTARRIIGAPDMVAEVLSPSTRNKDKVIKLNRYWKNGVREYWVIDPDCLIIHVYCFGDINGFSEYTFEDRVPLRIFEGRIFVNFAAIKRHLMNRMGFDPKDPLAPDDDDSDDRDCDPYDPTAA